MLRFLALVCLVAGAFGVGWDEETDLDRYVHYDDGAFSYEELTSYRYDNQNTTVYMYNMTSQIWLDDTQVSRPVWWHMVGIIIPDYIEDPTRAWVFTAGGSNRENTTPPGPADPFNILGSTVASRTGLIGGYVLQNPNGPIVFADDPTQRNRTSDSWIAYTWRSFLENPEPNPDVIARMAMTKVHKRGLDIVAEVAKEKRPETDITKFIVTGASKRGWTALSVAAVDQRVDMCLPIVFTLLNVKETMIRHNQAMNGTWSWALEPYYDEDITKEIFNEKMETIYKAEDVINYAERLTMLKVFILATGDEFFYPQDLDSFWDYLPEPKYIMMNPNAQHIVFPHYIRILETIQGVILSHIRGIPLPTLSWNKGWNEEQGWIEATVDPEPEEIRCSRANTVNGARRDFRLLAGPPGEIRPQPVFWNWTTVDEIAPGNYYYSEPLPEDDTWASFFIQGRWFGPDDNRMFFTTSAQTIPDTFPREPCTGAESCYGKLA